jgi:hypothetical protein
VCVLAAAAVEGIEYMRLYCHSMPTPLTLADIADKNVYMCAQEWCGSNVVRRVQSPAADRVRVFTASKQVCG